MRADDVGAPSDQRKLDECGQPRNAGTGDNSSEDEHDPSATSNTSDGEGAAVGVEATDAPATGSEEEPGTEEEGDGGTAEEQLAAVREMWMFPALLAFLRVFSHALQLQPFSADVLETAILGGSVCWLGELVHKVGILG
ncbi:hypothetical protein TSOC_005366 [Tetrabaena socialis]|uniref:DDT domain-containing protein n=1 Tax=Tetrabaena socialis TaxID=47790 RepID=A0A2J8A6H4_9CHLO|nr:hypothetical protein TSOC_005366 [Tetrabaena socialis]|eukprot:PNH08126.1 hypothetical protein TSOC_005366 [Tetrabaena socialis]